MKSYIIQIAGAAILAVFADILSPEGWKKYISIITGIILLTVITAPVIRKSNIDIMSGFEKTDLVMEKGEEIYADMLKLEFSKNLANDIKERVRQEFSKDVEAEVEVEINGGNIDRIVKIILRGKNLDKELADRISFIYDVDEVILDVL